MMRKFVLAAALLTAAGTAGAQTIGEVADSVKSATHKKNVKQMAQTVKEAFAVRAATAEHLVGTWHYEEPAVMSTSGNLLMKVVGNTAAGKLKKFLGEYINRGGITARNTYITFRADGTFTRAFAGRKTRGTWMVSGDKLMLALKNVHTTTLTTHVDGERIMILVPVEKIIDTMRDFGTLDDNITTKGIRSIAHQLKGMEGGFALSK